MTSNGAGGWTAPRTAWGDPDIQGQWNNQTSTPLQRPTTGPLADKETISEEEAETFEQTERRSFDEAPRAGDPGTYNAFWRDEGKALTRTSLITDPPDGRVPPYTAEAQARLAAERAERSKRGPADSYTDLSLWTRCVSRGWNGIGSWYSSNYQIFQSPGFVVVFQELIHEPRIIPLDGRPRLPQGTTQWLGDSRGRWEGDTLVVETTNFDPRTNFQGSRDTLRLIERYRLRDANNLDYEFTIDDPKTFTRQWTRSTADAPSDRRGLGLRIRLSRRQLRDDGNPARRADRGACRGSDEETLIWRRQRSDSSGSARWACRWRAAY